MWGSLTLNINIICEAYSHLHTTNVRLTHTWVTTAKLPHSYMYASYRLRGSLPFTLPLWGSLTFTIRTLTRPINSAYKIVRSGALFVYEFRYIPQAVIAHFLCTLSWWMCNVRRGLQASQWNDGKWQYLCQNNLCIQNSSFIRHTKSRPSGLDKIRCQTRYYKTDNTRQIL